MSDTFGTNGANQGAHGASPRRRDVPNRHTVRTHIARDAFAMGPAGGTSDAAQTAQEQLDDLRAAFEVFERREDHILTEAVFLRVYSH